MNLTVYLPDELAERGRKADLTFSRLLRNAVISELNRRETMSETLNESSEHVLYLEDNEYRGYAGRITGVEIASGDNEVVVYLTDDERVIVYDGRASKHYVLDEPVEGLREWLDDASYADAVRALGEDPVIDL